MARIPQREIDKLQREISVQRLAEVRGVKLKRSGREYMGLCPFHKDTDPKHDVLNNAALFSEAA